MKCVVTRRQDIGVSVWSGGSTAQLFIYPPDARYANRDFEVRISSAAVEEETSVFTNLPGYHRILMPLTAPLRLVYEGRGEVLLNPMEVTEFEGEWRTVSHGVCVDLGVMLAAGWYGEIEAVHCGTYESCAGFTGIYALADHVEVSIKKSGEPVQATLMQGDFLLLESRTAAKLDIKPSSANAAVMVRVFRV